MLSFNRKLCIQNYYCMFIPHDVIKPTIHNIKYIKPTVKYTIPNNIKRTVNIFKSRTQCNRPHKHKLCLFCTHVKCQFHKTYTDISLNQCTQMLSQQHVYGHKNVNRLKSFCIIKLKRLVLIVL